MEFDELVYCMCGLVYKAHLRLPKETPAVLSPNILYKGLPCPCGSSEYQLVKMRGDLGYLRPNR